MAEAPADPASHTTNPVLGQGTAPLTQTGTGPGAQGEPSESSERDPHSQERAGLSPPAPHELHQPPFLWMSLS